jgi:multidrug efflux system membrane fusion protein
MTDNRSTSSEQQAPGHIPARTAPAPRRRGWWLAAALLLIVAGALAWYFYAPGKPAEPQRRGKGGPNAASRPLFVATAPAATADVGVYLTGLGTVTPLHTVTVRSRVEGQLLRVAFREGQMVKAGELLAEIDPRPFQVQLTQAEGQMARDQALLRNAQLDLERYRTLFEQDSVARQQLDTQAALVRQYEGAVKSDQGQIDNARLQLTYARITAPVSGRIGLRQVDPGNIVRASDPNGIVVITQLQPISVIFTIPEDQVSAVMKRMRAGEKLPVEAWDRAEKNKLATGALVTVDNQIDPTTGTVKLRAQFRNEEFLLFPNQFVNARLLVEVLDNATVIPGAAVQRGAQGTFVYVVQPDRTVAVRPVKLGPPQGERVAVSEGVKPGEVLVVDGADKLREGARVQLPGDAPASDQPRAKGAGKGKGKGNGKGKAREDGSGDARTATEPSVASDASAAGTAERKPGESKGRQQQAP